MFVPFSKPTIGSEEYTAIGRVMLSGWLAAGPEVEAFEKEFADYVGVKYAIFTNSCTSALKMAYKWAKEQGVPTIYYPKNTFCATYSAADEVGLRHVAYINPHKVEIGSDFYGSRVNMHYGGIKDETPCLIEDSAHRIEPNDPLVGKIRCYSFYATKNMTTGSGGMFVTNDKEIYERARLYWRDGLDTTTKDRSEGRLAYDVKSFAGGYDGNDLAASIGRVQLRRLPEFNAQRDSIRRWYNEEFGQDWQGNHLYPYFVKTEEEVWSLVKFLQDAGIGCGYHYPGTGWLGVSLPIYPLLTDEQQSYVIEKVKEWRCL